MKRTIHILVLLINGNRHMHKFDTVYGIRSHWMCLFTYTHFHVCKRVNQCMTKSEIYCPSESWFVKYLCVDWLVSTFFVIVDFRGAYRGSPKAKEIRTPDRTQSCHQLTTVLWYPLIAWGSPWSQWSRQAARCTCAAILPQGYYYNFYFKIQPHSIQKKRLTAVCWSIVPWCVVNDFTR